LIRNEFQKLIQALQDRIKQLQSESHQIEQMKAHALKEQAAAIKSLKEQVVKARDAKSTATEDLLEEIISNPNVNSLNVNLQVSINLDLSEWIGLVGQLGAIIQSDECTAFTFMDKLVEHPTTPTTPTTTSHPARSILSASLQSQLDKLTHFRNKKIITEEEFQKKKDLIFNKATIKQEKIKVEVVKPFEPTSTENVPPLTQQQKSLLAKMLHFKQKGIITENEYNIKKDQIYSEARQGRKFSTLRSPVHRPIPIKQETHKEESTVKVTAVIPEPEPQTSVIVVQETAPKETTFTVTEAHQEPTQVAVIETVVVETHVPQVIETKEAFIEPVQEKPYVSSIPTPKDTVSKFQQTQLSRLNSFKENGILSEEEYLQKIDEILNTQVIHIYMQNIPATRKKPMKLVLNATDVLVRRRKDILKNQWVVIQSEVPFGNPGEDLKIKLELEIDAVDRRVTKEFNVTQGGSYFEIALNDETNDIVMKQHFDDSFARDTIVVKRKRKLSNAPVIAKKQPVARRLNQEDMEQLGNLNKLKEENVISEEEFQRKKRNILFGEDF
jgi:hypothetical protein